LEVTSVSYLGRDMHKCEMGLSLVRSGLIEPCQKDTRGSGMVSSSLLARRRAALSSDEVNRVAVRAGDRRREMLLA
jgi:hypothetical protein